MAQVIGAPLAAGLLYMDGLGGLRGWQWLFIIEGLVTSIYGVLLKVNTLFGIPCSRRRPLLAALSRQLSAFPCPMALSSTFYLRQSGDKGFCVSTHFPPCCQSSRVFLHMCIQAGTAFIWDPQCHTGLAFYLPPAKNLSDFHFRRQTEPVSCGGHQSRGAYSHIHVTAAVSADAVASKVPLPERGGEDVAAEPPGHAAQAVRRAQPAPRRLVG